jgi:hypothetical protein
MIHQILGVAIVVCGGQNLQGKILVVQNLSIKENMILISANVFTSRFQAVNPRVT